MEVATCFIAGCVVPIEEAWQWLLWSAAVGSCVGFAVTGVAGKLLDFIEARAARRERIENARYRNHVAVPPMTWGDQ
ncbi:hypothetical protein [Variovorax sp.]|jgi:NhaP-type Na+/H+ or K+/H+ antiporter|uniref:hypothetical protein n=1 Tax=Variovorax sp. TaxID=1871043 RepID=UPI00403811B6